MLRLLVLASCACLQAPTPSTTSDARDAAKLEIVTPVLDRDRTIKAIMLFNTPVKRYEFDLKSDKLDGSQTRSLFLHVMSDMWDAGRANIHENSQQWVFRSVLDDDGERYSVEYIAIAWDATYSLRTESQLSKEQFTLRYKASPKPASIAAASAERSLSDGLYHTIETVRFDLQRAQLLDIADGGMMRIVYGDRQVDLELDAGDVEAIRWFVWEKVKGGKDLMRARYTMVEKPKAVPADAPKPDAAKDKPAPAPAPAPAPTPKPEEKPKRAA